MKNIYLSVLYVLALTLVLSSSLLAYDIQFFGNGVLPTPEDEANIKAYIDLGQTQAGVEDWEKWQPESSTVIILPSNEDIQNHQDILRKMEENGKLVAVSDLLDDSQYPVFPPYSIFTENYHSIVFLNFVGDGSIFLDEESIQAIQKLTPEKIFVIGTEKNLPLIQEKLAIFESIPVEVIEREKITANYSQIASVPENPVILFFYSSRCPTCRKLKNETTIPIFEKYQDQIKVVYLDYIFSENYEKLVFLEEQWQVENTTSVELFSEAGYVAAEENENVNSKIEELIQKTISLSETDKKKVTSNTSAIEDIIFQRFKGFTPWVVAGAGVLDGLN
ncbi:MAG: thioredoxin domain-containing protein, partial [Atribacterota bacterium]|nr:thioredoxin domain-containing protein [Atribacterota bacterium]